MTRALALLVLAGIAAGGCSLAREVIGARGGGGDAGDRGGDGGTRVDSGVAVDSGEAVDAFVADRDVGEPVDAAGRCSGDSDCPADIPGAWGSCVFGPDPCANLGSEARPVTQYACVSHACVASVTMELEACGRDTEGLSCAADACSGCAPASAGTCSSSGTQSCTTMTCRSGTCVGATEMRSCSVDVFGHVCMAGPWGPCTWTFSGCEQRRNTTTCATDGFCVIPSSESRSCSGC